MEDPRPTKSCPLGLGAIAIVIGLCEVVFGLVSAIAQDTNQYKTVTVTNWVKAGPYLKVVNGKLYNIAYSRLWGQPFAGLKGLADDGHMIRYEAIPTKQLGDKLFCDIYGITYWYETYTAARQDESRDFYKTIVIYHSPTNFIFGKPFFFNCMKVDDLIEDKHFICEAYDCGTDPTNLIPVVKSVRVKSN